MEYLKFLVLFLTFLAFIYTASFLVGSGWYQAKHIYQVREDIKTLDRHDEIMREYRLKQILNSNEDETN
jgi:hypothetical protein